MWSHHFHAGKRVCSRANAVAPTARTDLGWVLQRREPWQGGAVCRPYEAVGGLGGAHVPEVVQRRLHVAQSRVSFCQRSVALLQVLCRLSIGTNSAHFAACRSRMSLQPDWVNKRLGAR